LVYSRARWRARRDRAE